MNGTHQALAYVGHVNLIGDDIRTMERNEDVLLDAYKDIGSLILFEISVDNCVKLQIQS